MEALRTLVPTRETRSSSGSDAPRTERLESRVVDVPGGTVVVRISRGTDPQVRPVVFVPGWGKSVQGFADLFESLDPEVTLYFAESREKTSSTMAPDADFSMRRYAADLGICVRELGLNDSDWVAMGSCFGAAVILQALVDRKIRPGISICYDPMPRMWVPRWILRGVVPWLPLGFVALVRPLVRDLLLMGMKEPTQQHHSRVVIDEAVLWKWKRGSVQMGGWSAFRIASRVGYDVHVVNGTNDRFHNASVYPQIAASLPKGVFLHIPVDESLRNALMGRVASEYSMDAEGGAIPPRLERYARDVTSSQSERGAPA